MKEGHPWSAKWEFRNGVRREKAIEDDMTSAFWEDGYLHTLGVGKPYADRLEYEARRDGSLLGTRWVGDEPPYRYIACLKMLGKLP